MSTKRWPHRSNVIAAPLAIALIAAIAAGLAMDGTRESQPGREPAPGEHQTALLVRALDYLRHHYPEHFSSASLSATNSLIIYRKPGSDLDTAVHARFPTVEFEFHDARFAAIELGVLAQRVWADASYWRQQGIKIWDVTPRRDGNGVEVATDQPDEAREPLERRYGTAVTPIRGGHVKLI